MGRGALEESGQRGEGGWRLGGPQVLGAKDWAGLQCLWRGRMGVRTGFRPAPSSWGQHPRVL